MDSKGNNEINLQDEIKKPYVKVTIQILIIVFIICAGIYLTQSYWMNAGVKVVYKEYKAEEILSNNNIPDGVFILSGNYSYISNWVNTTRVQCAKNNNVKLLVMSQRDVSNFKNVIVMNAIEGCN